MTFMYVPINLLSKKFLEGKKGHFSDKQNWRQLVTSRPSHYKNSERKSSGLREMIPDRKFKFTERNKEMEISDTQVNIKYCIFLLISLKGTCLFEAKVIILYGGIFNVYRTKIYDNSTKNRNK